jgi:hypothetical protein
MCDSVDTICAAPVFSTCYNMALAAFYSPLYIYKMDGFHQGAPNQCCSHTSRAVSKASCNHPSSAILSPSPSATIAERHNANSYCKPVMEVTGP